MTQPSGNVATCELPDPGDVPVLDWISVDLIDADPLYQRPLDTARVTTILNGFTWRSFGALVIVPAGERYHVTDGQHRLEAAKLHPNVTHVPAVIVRAENVSSEASIFVDINKNRKNVTSLELFFAQLAADDDDALTIQQVCAQSGVRIPKHPGDFRPGDSIAVAAISALIGRCGAKRAGEYLQVLTAAGFKPITAAQIKAVEHVMTDPEFRGQVTLEDLQDAIITIGAAADIEAKRFGATHKVSVWKGLANVWFAKSKKRRAPSVKPAVSPSANLPTPQPSIRKLIPYAGKERETA